MKLNWKWVSIGFFLVFFLVTSVTFIQIIHQAYLFVHPENWHENLTPEDYQLPFEKNSFYSGNEKTLLQGWFIPSLFNSKDRPTIIMIHDRGKNSSSLLSQAKVLRQGNYNLFLFDVRNHGQSSHSGFPYSFGIEEQQDIEGVLNFLRDFSNLRNSDYFLFSEGMAAGTIFLCPEKILSRIKGIVFSKPYRDIAEWILEKQGSVFFWAVQILSDYDLKEKLNYAEILATKDFPPHLFLHGSEDANNSSENSKLLFLNSKISPDRKKIFYFLGSGEEDFSLKNKESFFEEVNFFFKNCL